VLPNFRGNKLQDILLKISIEEAQKRNYDIMATTVSPNNFYSINNFIRNDFKILKIIEGEEGLYKGHKRYIMYKNLN